MRHILPNALDTLFVQTTLDVAAVTLVISGLSFIGVGAQIPQAEWGAMIADGRTQMTSAWWAVLFPGLAIALTAIGFNLVGDLLRSELTRRFGHATSTEPVSAAHAEQPRRRTSRCEARAASPEPPLLAVRGLRTTFRTRRGEIRAVDGLDFEIAHGERVGIVGESGSGKSVTAFSILGLLRDARVEGEIGFEGRNLAGASKRELRSVRGDRIALIFQDPCPRSTRS